MNKFAQNCISNNNEEGFNFTVQLDAVYTTAGDGYWSDTVKDVRVTEMGIYVSKQSDDGEYYCDGDFYISYDEDTWNDDEDGLIYTDSAFIAYVREYMQYVLMQMGASETQAINIANSIEYSEQGMQDYGRVSCDAYELADFLRNFYANELV